MMRMRTKKTQGTSALNGDLPGGVGGSEVSDWEMRPGGMLVQKRNPDSDRAAPTIRVKVKYGSSHHEIYVNSQASFGELKKLLAEPTGLHHEDQKLMFKDKERSSNAYLDVVGVKDGSKLVLVEDPISREKRYLEMRKNVKMEKASKSISEISLEVDNLAAQVSALESVISKGEKVAETDVLNLTELLMNQLIKLDGIVADGDVKAQRRMQVRRVQKYVETLDLLKIRNAMPPSNSNGDVNSGQIQMQQLQQQKHKNGYANGDEMQRQQQQQHQHQQKHSTGQVPKPMPQQQQQRPRHSTGQISSTRQQSQQPSRHSASGTIVTTQWETFEFDVPGASSTSTAGVQGQGQGQSQSQSPRQRNTTTTPSKFSWDFLQ